MQYIITPARFNKFSKPAITAFSVLTFILFIAGLYISLYSSPPDYQQGEAVRIMYVHVPSAWLAMGVYLSLSISSASFLIWKNPLSGIFLKCSIPIGAVFTLICLITGAIWAKPIWGVYWTWDARLTSMLILLFIYIGLYILYNAFEDPEKAGRATSILALIGLVNLPVIRFSVKWWNTLHQPASVMRLDTPALDNSILFPLLVMSGFFLSLFLTLLVISVKTEILKRKNQRIILQ
jgi:heme exporter protein C